MRVATGLRSTSNAPPSSSPSRRNSSWISEPGLLTERAEMLASGILFLVSDRSSYMTGHALVAEGGESLAGGTNAGD